MVGNPVNLCTGCNRSWCPKSKLDKAGARDANLEEAALENSLENLD
jgi:hypothetical protein